MYKEYNVILLKSNEKTKLNTVQSNINKHLGISEVLTYNQVGLDNILHTSYNIYIISKEVVSKDFKGYAITVEKDNPIKPHKLINTSNAESLGININTLVYYNINISLR